MTKCKYILYLPGGNKIELPASFGLLTPTKELDDLILKYQASVKDKKSDAVEKIDEDEEQDQEQEQGQGQKESNPLSDLLKSLKPLLPSNIHINTIRSIITKATDSDEIYRTINELILKSGTFDNIDSAIYNYISQTSKKGKEAQTIKDLKQKLTAERNPSYFKDFGVQGVLGVTTLQDEKIRIYSKNLENYEFGFSAGITENLYTVLSALNATYKSQNVRSTLYGVKSPLIGKAWSTDDFVIYELNNDLALFLALFKNEATKVPIEKLLPILEDLNKILKTKKNGKLDLEEFNINEFFRGKITDKKIHTSYFEDLLEKADEPAISQIVDKILSLVSKTMHPNWTGLTAALKHLCALHKPKQYGKLSILKQQTDVNYINSEAKIEETFKEQRLSFFEMSAEVRDTLYSAKETIKNNVYENAVKKIIINKDIVKFPEGSKGAFAIVTHIYDRGKDGAMVYGVYKNTFGTLKKVSALFKNGELEYRKYEGPIEPTDLNEEILPKLGAIVPVKDLSQDVIKTWISKGDKINGDLVIGVFPSYINVQKPNNTKGIVRYSSVKSFSSEKLLKQIEFEKISPTEDYRHMINITNINDIQAGDYFWYKTGKKGFYKKVLFVDEENVYSWVDAETGNYVIKATPKQEITTAKYDAKGEMTLEESKDLLDNVNKISLSKSTLSSFTDKALAKEGDYFYGGTDEKSFIFGKITSNNRILLFPNQKLTGKEIHSLEFLNSVPNVKYYTNRDISSKYALFTNRVNTWAIEFKAEADNPLDVEVEYIIPKGLDYSNIETLPNGYLSAGTYSIPEKINTEDYEIITSEVLKVNNKPSNFKVFIRKESAENNYYQRNLTSLMPINYFDKLSYETKKELNLITPGTYFSVYQNESTMSSKIYRVVSVNGDVVKAQVNRISEFGKIITEEVDFSLDTLLQSKGLAKASPILSIAKLYLITGNSKINAVLEETAKLPGGKTAKTLTAKSVNAIIRKLKTHIKKSGIKVEVVPHSDIFKDNQYAAIITDEEGKTMVAISDKFGTAGDAFHEFLHLFLTPLRYNHPQIYNAFIQSIVNDVSLNITDAEEQFVKTIVSKIESHEDFVGIFENMQTFVNGLKSILTDVNPEYEVTSEENPVALLKTPLSTLFEIDKENTSHPMYNLGLITTEPMMREWIKMNNITLNCS